MTVSVLPRQLGARLSCNHPGCDECLVTGQIVKRGLRVYAHSIGWIRGMDPGSGNRTSVNGRKANGRWDICPAHAVEEIAKRDARLARGAEMRAARDARRVLPLEEQAAFLAAKRLASRERAKAKRLAKKEAEKLAPTVAV